MALFYLLFCIKTNNPMVGKSINKAGRLFSLPALAG